MDPSYTGQGEPPATGADLDAYYRATPRETVKRVRGSIMSTQGVYVPTRWVKRWDLQTAAYLADFVSYVGKQRDPEGWIWKSWTEVEDETGLTRGQQERVRKVLRDAGIIEIKTGGIGNKVHVRVNIPLLGLIDGLPSAEEVEETHWREATRRDSVASRGATVADQAARVADQGATVADQDARVASPGATQNSNTTTNTHKNTLVKPSSPDERGFVSEKGRTTTRREIKEGGVKDEKIEKCAEMLQSIEGFELSTSDARRLVSVQADRYPLLDPADVCRKYRDHAAEKAGKGDPIRRHPAYLPGFFERTDQGRTSERPNPHGAEAERVKDKPMKAERYVTEHGVPFEFVDSLIELRLGHTEIERKIKAERDALARRLE